MLIICVFPTGFCGVMSIFSSLRYCLGDPTEKSNLYIALAFLPFGLFFDFLDGRVARWRKKSSMMGQELDSLADLVCATPLLSYGWLTCYIYFSPRPIIIFTCANDVMWQCRFPSALLPPVWPSVSVCAPLSTTCSWLSSCFAA